MPSGTSIAIEGSADEIEDIIQRIEGGAKGSSRVKKSRETSSAERATGTKEYVLELRETGLFEKPLGLGDVKKALEAEGHIVPVTTLSGVMLNLVKRRELRRLKDGKAWMYVKR
jgi:hypothetical protein